MDTIIINLRGHDDLQYICESRMDMRWMSGKNMLGEEEIKETSEVSF